MNMRVVVGLTGEGVAEARKPDQTEKKSIEMDGSRGRSRREQKLDWTKTRGMDGT